MTGWNEGYIADIPYTSNFYRETVPTNIAFAALANGRSPGPVVQPKRVLELGFGTGFGLVLTAAANPDTQFEGCDFLPQHALQARNLADEAGLTNLAVSDASFQDLAAAAVEGQQDLDLIVMHGILTWVSDEARDAIIEIARKRLKLGGLLYASYNCFPGFARFLPVRHLLRENAKRCGGGTEQQVRSGLELLKGLSAEGASLFSRIKDIDPFVDKLFEQPTFYVAHEFLNENWSVFQFSDVAALMATAKLDYVASATIAENIDLLITSEPLRKRIAAEPDPIHRETLNDAAINKEFRRDIYGRGSLSLSAAEQVAELGRVEVVLLVPRSRVTYEMKSAVGTTSFNHEICDVIFNRLEQGSASIAELVALFDEARAPFIAKLVCFLVHSGQVAPVAADGGTRSIDAARRFNQAIARRAARGHHHRTLACPLIGSGLAVAAQDVMVLAAMDDTGSEESNVLTDHVIEQLRATEANWIKDGQVVSDPAVLKQLVGNYVSTFLSDRLPLWRRLRMV